MDFFDQLYPRRRLRGDKRMLEHQLPRALFATNEQQALAVYALWQNMGCAFLKMLRWLL